MSTTASSATYASGLEAFSLEKADASIGRSLKKAGIDPRAETETFRSFTALERVEYLRECFAKYDSLLMEGRNHAKAFGLDERDFAGPLWHRQQVAFLKRREAQFAPLEHLFAK